MAWDASERDPSILSGASRRRFFTMTWLAALSSWLGSAKADKRRFADIAEFRELVMAAFRRQPGVDSVVADSGDPAKLAIAIGGRSVTGDFTNIFGYLNNNPGEDADRTVIRFKRSSISAKNRIA